MMTPICPRLLNLINDFVLLRFRARAHEDLSAIEVILLLLLLNVELRNYVISRQIVIERRVTSLRNIASEFYQITP